MFSKTCQYAIRAVLYIALNTNDDQKLGVDEIAGALHVPKHFLAKILQHMTRHNLASSMKGRNGGFYLSDANKQLSLLTVIEAFDGSEAFNSCILGLQECSGENPCTLHAQAVVHRQAMMKILGDQSIEQLTQTIQKHNFKV